MFEYAVYTITSAPIKPPNPTINPNPNPKIDVLNRYEINWKSEFPTSK